MSGKKLMKDKGHTSKSRFFNLLKRAAQPQKEEDGTDEPESSGDSSEKRVRQRIVVKTYSSYSYPAGQVGPVCVG